MLIEIRQYLNRTYYWDSYEDTIKLEMIQALQKDVGYAFSYGTEHTKLYKIYFKDGEKMFTDLGGYRKILKASRQSRVDLHVL